MKRLNRSVAVLAFLGLSGCAFADNMAWVADGGGNFGTVDLNSGAFSQTSSFGFTPSGLGEIGSTVYTSAAGGTTLYSVDTSNGALHSVGTSNISLMVFGSTNTGLYTIDSVGGLWNVNPATGQSTLIGSTLLPVGSNSIGMSTGSDVLYVSLASSIYTINTTTGQASYIGNSGATDFGALVSSRGSLYASSVVQPNALYSFSQTSGAATFIAQNELSQYAFGLAPMVPEPGTFGLFGVAATLLGLLVWKRRKTAALAKVLR